MKINYKLTYQDFLEYQLYSSSKSELHRKKRFRSRIIIPILYIILGIYFANKDEGYLIGILFTVLGILWYVFYPLYSKWTYRRYIKKFVEENYKNRINKEVELDFDVSSVSAKDYTSESKINENEIKELIETRDHFFIKLDTDVSLIIPKHAIENKEEFKKRILDFGAVYVDELKWEWK